MTRVDPSRSNPLKPLWVLFFGILAVTALTLVGRSLGPKEMIPWRSDFAAARDEAGRTGKPVMAYFTAEWCGPCQSLKTTTWADQDVEAALRDFVPVKVDVDENANIAEEYGVNGIPTFIVLGADGKPLKTSGGALPPAEFVEWLKSS